jgi:monoamine oxidase
MRHGEPVVVIGAGAAGLAAARELVRMQLPVVVLEARRRLFGRVHTIQDRAWPGPIELGAEFIHDDAPLSLEMADRNRLPLEVVPERRRRLDPNHSAPLADPDALLKKFLRFLPRGHDRSLAAILSARRRARPQDLETVRAYVEGYHAADLTRISARALRALFAGPDGSSIQQRPLPGYASLLRALSEALKRAGVIFRTAMPVTRVRWKKGRVHVDCASLCFHARAAIITIPLPLLRARALALEPLPAAWPGALAHLEMGTVRKIALLFAEPFWDAARVARRLRGRGRTSPNFWHDPRETFPTWWTLAPRTAPVLTAWAGGPRADRLRGLSATALTDRAVATLARMLGLPRTGIDRLLVDAKTHDWTADTWTRGGYSYVGVGGLAAQRELARPVEETLVLAGEALDREHVGTVEGALASGRHAARSLLRGWK